MAGFPYEALRFANRLRKNVGLKPAAKLRPATSGMNPVEATVAYNNKRVTQISTTPKTTTLATTTGDSLSVSTPQGVSEFLTRYKQGKYPALSV